MSPSLRPERSHSDSHAVHSDLSDPALRLYLARYLRRRLPSADADDALQAVYCAALEARRLPEDATELRKWLTGIARRKVAQYYRRASGEQLGDVPEQAAPVAPVEELSLLRWAEQQAAESHVEHVEETLDWMARESDGEKLETIAAEANLSPPRVRQRVSRLRRFMRARWALELSAALLAVAFVVWLWRRPNAPIALSLPLPMPSVSVQTPAPERDDRAVELRKGALRSCELGRYRDCVRALDEAESLDPAGDAQPSVVEARKHAMEKLAVPVPTVTKPNKPSVTKSKSKAESGTPMTGKSK